MIRYGRKDCKHVFRHRKDGWEEGCVPTICIECGAFGCQCDADSLLDKKVFFGQGATGDANLNGSWENPYVVR